jgi:hypothetical protein
VPSEASYFQALLHVEKRKGQKNTHAAFVEMLGISVAKLQRCYRRISNWRMRWVLAADELIQKNHFRK